MKKFLSIVLILALMLTFTACSSATVITYSTYWGRENVNEVCVYDVSVKYGEANSSVPKLSGNGTYTTTITGGNEEGFTATTLFEFVGEYTLPGGEVKAVEEKIETKTVFANAVNSFKPVSSERKYNGSTLAYKNGKFTLEPLNYSSSVNYSDNKAKASLNVEGGSASFGLPASFEINVGKTAFFDNEQMPYLLRAMLNDTVYDKGLNSTITLISPLSKDAINLTVVAPAKTTEKIDLKLNGADAKFDAYKVGIQKSGKNAGSPLYYYFAKGDSVDGKNAMRLLKIEQTVAYTKDTLVFTLSNYTNA